MQLAVARGMERDGNLRGAESAYEAAVRNDANNVAAIHRLALVKEKLGAGDVAGQLLEDAARRAPDHPEILCDLGYWHALRDHRAEAEKCYVEAIRRRPDFARAHVNLGLLVASGGDQQAALKHFSAAGLTPAEAHANVAFGLMGGAHWPQAQDQLHLALRNNPKLPQAAVLSQTFDKIAQTSAAPAEPERGAQESQFAVAEALAQDAAPASQPVPAAFVAPAATLPNAAPEPLRLEELPIAWEHDPADVERSEVESGPASMQIVAGQRGPADIVAPLSMSDAESTLLVVPGGPAAVESQPLSAPARPQAMAAKPATAPPQPARRDSVSRFLSTVLRGDDAEQ